MGAYHSTDRSETATLRAIFIAPTEGGYHSTHHSETGTLRAIFIAPTGLRMFYIPPYNRAQKIPRVLLGKRYRVGQGIYRIGTIPKRN